MTSALYLDDAFLKEFSTTVTSVKDGKFVTLDETAFYPNSGGQPHDTGVLVRASDGKEFPVVYVGKFSGEISHEIKIEGLQEGDEVNGKIDWDRRYWFMRMHTAAHLLSYIFHKEDGALITGNQLGEEKSRIDFNLEDFDRDKIDSYFSMANAIIAKNHPVSVSYMSRDEAEKDPSLFKLAKGLPEGIKNLRIVSIGDLDRQADGGTHVKTLKEVGTIVFQSAKNKGKSNRRVYFTLSSAP